MVSRVYSGIIQDVEVCAMQELLMANPEESGKLRSGKSFCKGASRIERIKKKRVNAIG
jgi:hypothetical protein